MTWCAGSVVIDIDRALDLYRKRLAQADMVNYPEAFACHFAGERVLGDVSAHDMRVEAAMFWLMIPFAYAASVTTSFVIFEAHRAPHPETAMIDAERVLYGSRLAEDGNGYRTTHWVIPYSITDAGERAFGEPELKPYFVPKVNETLGLILETRAEHHYFTYEEAIAAVLRC
jgi:hypothetical protein